MKRWSRKAQKDKFLKKGKKLMNELKHLKEKEIFYLKKISAAENAACSDAIEPVAFKAQENLDV